MQNHAVPIGPSVDKLGYTFKKPLCGNAVAFLLFYFIFFEEWRPLHPHSCLVLLDFIGSGLNLLHRQLVHSIAFHKKQIDCENQALKLYLQLVLEKHFPWLGNPPTTKKKKAFAGKKKTNIPDKENALQGHDAPLSTVDFPRHYRRPQEFSVHLLFDL